MLAIVAWRVYAIYNGQRWICRLLWIAGFLNFAISAGISTVALIPIIRESLATIAPTIATLKIGRAHV